jgi:hypothetical protein
MKKKNKEKERKPAQVIDPNRLVLFLSVFCFLLILIHIVAALFPQGRIWGLNQWAYFPSWLSLAVGVLVLLVFIPAVNASLRDVVGSVLSSFSRILHARVVFGKRRKLFLYLLFSLPFFFLFWGLKDRTHLLGDGAQIISQMNSGQLSIKWSEPLEIFVHLRAFDIIRSLWQIDAASFYALFSCLAGIIFVFFVFILVDFWGEQKKERILIFLILLNLGSIQLFFGYAEHYSLSYLLVFVFILSSLGYLKRKVVWFLPPITFALAALSHFSNLCLLPALLFLFLPAQENRIGAGLHPLPKIWLDQAADFRADFPGSLCGTGLSPLFASPPFGFLEPAISDLTGGGGNDFGAVYRRGLGLLLEKQNLSVSSSAQLIPAFSQLRG